MIIRVLSSLSFSHFITEGEYSFTYAIQRNSTKWHWHNWNAKNVIIPTLSSFPSSVYISMRKSWVSSAVFNPVIREHGPWALQSQNPSLWLKEQRQPSNGYPRSILIKGWCFLLGNCPHWYMVLLSNCCPSSALGLRPLAFLVLSLEKLALRRLKDQRILGGNFTQEKISSEVLEKLKLKIVKKKKKNFLKTQNKKTNKQTNKKPAKKDKDNQRPNHMEISVIWLTAGPSRELILKKDLAQLRDLLPTGLSWYTHELYIRILIYIGWSKFRDVRSHTLGHTTGKKREA